LAGVNVQSALNLCLDSISFRRPLSILCIYFSGNFSYDFSDAVYRSDNFSTSTAYESPWRGAF